MFWLLAAGWLTILLAPGTSIAQSLRHYLVCAPAALLNRVGRRHVQLAAGLSLMFLGAWWLGHDALNIARMASPEAAIMLGSVDLTVCLDLIVTVVLTWSVARVGTVGATIRSVRRRWAGGRTSRARRERRPTPAANDDDDRRWARAA